MPKENSKKSIQNTRFEKEARALKKNLEKRKQQERLNQQRAIRNQKKTKKRFSTQINFL